VYGSPTDARRAKRQAEQTAEKFRRAQSNHRAGIIAMPTLDEWFDTLMQREWGQNRPGTQERRRTDYDLRIRAALGSKKLDAITAPVVNTWLFDVLDAEGNRRCIQAAYETLREMLTVAQRHHLLPDNAARHVRYPVEQMQVRERHALTREEYRRLLAACRDDAERTFIRVLCEAGLRRSEAIALQAGDLDLDAGFIHVQRRHYRLPDGTVDIDTPKTHRTRRVAINTSLAAALRGHLATSQPRDDESPVFTRCNRYTRFGKVHLTGAAAYKILKRVSRIAGITLPDRAMVSPHILRATGASIAVASGVPPHIAQHQLGHTDIRTTHRYLRLPMHDALHEFGAVFE
jgi:integrase